MQEYLQEKKTVALGAGFGMFGYALSTILGILTNVVLYRRFDHNSEVELWVVAFSFFAILEPFARLGLAEGVQRFIGIAWVKNDWGRVRGAILGSLQLSGLASLIMILGVFFWAPFIGSIHSSGSVSPERLAKVVRCFSIYLLPIALTTISLAILRALNDIRHSVLVETMIQKFGWFLVVLGIGFLPPTEHRVIGLVWGMVLVNVLAFLISISYYGKAAPKLKNIAPIYERKALLLFSLPLVFQTAILIFMKKCDILVLSHYYLGEGLAAQYNAAGIATLVIANILVAYSSLFAPLIAKVSEQKDYKRMKELYQTVTRWMLYITLPAAAMMLLFPEQILQIFKLTPTPLLKDTLRLLVCAQIVSTVAGHSGTMLVMSGYSRLTLYINILAVGINLVLNFLLIPGYSMAGAAVATLASISIRNVLAVLLTFLLVKSHPFSFSTLTISFTAILCGLAAYFLFPFVQNLLPKNACFQNWGVQLLLAGLLYLVFYAPATLLTMHRDDRRFLFDEVLPRLRQGFAAKHS